MPIAIKKQMLHKNEFGVTPENLVTQMHNLLTNGRKTIATIDNVEYLRMQNPEVLHKLYNRFDSQKKMAFFLSKKPLFKVSYRFNPPDDNRSADIIHSFITQSEPENHYQVGEPLPILYHIEDKVFYDVVTSMPFPLSDLDLNEHTIGYIVDSSIGRQLTEDEVTEVFVLKERLSDLCESMPNDLDQFNSPNHISYLFPYHAQQELNRTESKELLEMTQALINAQTIGELNHAVSMSLTFVKPGDESMRRELISYLCKILMVQRVYPCHANCIFVLSQMAFSVSCSNQSSVDMEFASDAFKLIKSYMSYKPRCLTAEISKQLLSIREYPGFDKRYEGEFHELLFDILEDPMISKGARTVIAYHLCHEESLEVIQKTLHIIRDMDGDLFMDKSDIKRLLELSVIDLSAEVFC